MTAYVELLARMPKGIAPGKERAIRKLIAAGDKFVSDGISISKMDDLSSLGKAGRRLNTVLEAGAHFTRSQRQFRYHADMLKRMREAVRVKAIGEAKPTDVEWRSYLRSLSDGDRTQLVLTDSAARGAALREPGLAKISDEIAARATERAIAENAPDEARKIEAFEESQAVFAAALKVLQRDLQETPCIVVDAKAGTVRRFNSSVELDKLLADKLSKPTDAQITAEQVDVDDFRAAA